MSALIIAEAGVNHNGDISMAKKLIDVAVDAGADLVKFQTFNAEKLATRNAMKADYQLVSTESSETQYDMLKRLELSEKMHVELIDHCFQQNIGFLSTGFDIESISTLVDLGINLLKIPSGEIDNLPYLRYVGQFRLPIILSTGMANMADIEVAIEILEKAGTDRSLITLLHCTTQYPTPMEEVNLNAMVSLQAAFGVEVGYSDHTAGIEVAIAAVTLGATVIEKHFTLDKSLPGPDHVASLEPNELKNMVAAIRNIEVAMGNGIKHLTPSELINRQVARKSIVASKAIRAGEIFTSDNITTKRPATGMSPMNWDAVLGSKASRDFDPDEIIEL